jgi:hypothetical protein
MTTIFTHEMTDEQVRLAKAAGKLARKQASGSSLYDSLTVGEALLVGRAAAMKAARVNHPNGKQYAQAFAAWKKQFGFTADNKGLPLPTQYLDNCILAAANRTIADKIIAELSPAQRAGLGISGLAARVRKAGGMRPPRMTPTRQMQEQLTDLTFALDRTRHGLAEAALRRYGLAIDEEGNLVVIDEKKFAAWLNARQPAIQATEPR